MVRMAWIGLAFFVAFAAAGFMMGRSVVTTEPYMLATIAQSSSIQMVNKGIQLSLHNGKEPPYWVLDLGDFVLDSFAGKTLSVQNTQMLTFLSGGAASTTAGTLYKEILAAKKSGDFHTTAAMVVGGFSGYLAGYYLATSLAKPTDKEILAALRKPEMVEKVKKYVFISLLKKHGFPAQPIVVQEDVAKTECASIEDEHRWAECYMEALHKADTSAKARMKQQLFRQAQKSLSSDRIPLKGIEFLIFEDKLVPGTT
jgi:hypothetical protein